MLKRRTVVTFEMLERSFYHFPNSEPDVAECPECAQEVSWLTPNQAVLLTGISLRELFRRIEAGTIHFNEASPDPLRVCPNSFGIE